MVARFLLVGEKAWLKFSAAPLLERFLFDAALELVDCDQRLRLSSPSTLPRSAASTLLFRLRGS